jgi:GntR family transcriptional regulator of vanillate catabolism
MLKAVDRGKWSRADYLSRGKHTLMKLREIILAGEFKPGERLFEPRLAVRLGVSRTPIRLALDRLAIEGLLDTMSTGGFIVHEFTIEEIWDAVDLRGVLEGTAARLTAERFVQTRDLNILHNYWEQMEQVVTAHQPLERYLPLNDAFHSALVELARSPSLRRALDRLQAIPFASRSALALVRSTLGRENMAMGQEEHLRIIEAIEHHEGLRAESLAREHARVSSRRLELALMNKSIASRMPGAALIKQSATTRGAG